MKLTRSITEFGKMEGRGNTEKEHMEKARKKRLKEFCEMFLETAKKTTQVIAIAFGTTLLAYGCAFNSMGRFNEDSNTDADAEAEVDSVPDSVEPDLPDEVDIADVPDVETDGEDIEEEEGVEPTCFEIPAPLDPDVDMLLKNTREERATFVGPGSKVIDTAVQKNVSMTGYPDIILGECPDNPDAVAFIGGSTREHTFEYDISLIAGSTFWAATVPNSEGRPCSPMEVDSERIVSHNADQQQVPKNALMGSVPVQAGFLLESINSGMVAYEIDAIMETSGTITVPVGAYSPVTTVKAFVLFGSMEIDVEVPAGASSDVHNYAATLTGSNSKEARIYPRTLSDNQIYNVAWDESEVIWCARCVGNEILTVVVPGDIICKVADVDCGCIGDGFTIAITSVALDKAGAPYEIRGYYEEADPPVRSAAGVGALSNPATDHPTVTVTLEKNRTGGLSDEGEMARLGLIIDVTLTSEHLNLSGTLDTLTYTIVVPVTDPLAFGTSQSPNYTEDCGGCTPIL